MTKNTCIKLPLIPLRELTVFPNMIISFAVGREKSMDALEVAMGKDEIVFLVTQKDARTLDPVKKDLYEIGTIAKVKQVLKLPGNLTHIIVEGVKRGKLIDFLSDEKYPLVEIQEFEQYSDKAVTDDAEAKMRVASDTFDEYNKMNTRQNRNEAIINILSAVNPGQMADVIAAGMVLKPEQKQALLEIVDPDERLEEILGILIHELSVLRLKKEIEEKVKDRVDKTQKEYFLREQIKVIQEELGDKDGIQAEVDAFKQKLSEKKLPTDTETMVTKEINRLSKIPVSSPESNVIRNYLDCILDLPWNEVTKEKFDLQKAEKILNEDHFGLEKVKERILEFLAVRQNVPKLHSPIICLVGPPGVGKTSIARSIAKSLNRKYVRMSLGGVKDEAEMRGHRKTYVGAMPGRIINAMKQAQTINPLMLLDEVDKLSSSYNGDPASALLEVLDAEQNHSFRDHYIEAPYDLSQVLFICTANSLEPISAALRDRMEIVSLSGYTPEEKVSIAQKHLYPKQLKKHGLKKNQLKLSKDVFQLMIDNYTRESGVRQLERVIGDVCRKTVKLLLSNDKKQISITCETLEDFLGRKKFKFDSIENEPQIGAVKGLAWTQSGGDTLSIEVNVMKGDGKFELTGSMGDVMKESAKAAISYIRAQSDAFKLDEDFYKMKDIHIHIPEGAVPKDGPSAGITMATAMISALTGAHVRNDVAMTGEITIRGHVLAIGGLKEKVIAAKRAGIKKIILPHTNKKDLEELSEQVKTGIEFVFAREIKDVLDNALVKGESVWK